MVQPKFPHPASCYSKSCSLAARGQGFVPATLPAGGQILFVGEAAGYDEIVRGEPFVGAAGGVLSRLCIRAGIERKHCGIANACSCHPPGDYLVGAPWEDDALANCREFWVDAVRQLRPKVIVPLGATALKSVLGLHGQKGIEVKNFHGYVEWSKEFQCYVVPTFHPSHLQRGAMNLLEVVTCDLKKAATISRAGFKRSPMTLIVDPPAEWFGRWVDQHLRAAQGNPDIWWAGDTEFVGSTGKDEDELDPSNVTLTRFNVSNRIDQGITVPYHQSFIPHIARLLAAGGWHFWWNKDVDLEVLSRAGHAIAADQAIDLMWLWHYVQSDLPRSLGFVTSMYSDGVAWKHWGKDPLREGPYAAKDGVETLRIAYGLIPDAQQLGVWDQFLSECHDRDRIVLKPASAIGLPVDRPALEAFHVDLQAKLARVLAKLNESTAEGVLAPEAGVHEETEGRSAGSAAVDLRERREVEGRRRRQV